MWVGPKKDPERKFWKRPIEDWRSKKIENLLFLILSFAKSFKFKIE